MDQSEWSFPSLAPLPRLLIGPFHLSFYMLLSYWFFQFTSCGEYTFGGIPPWLLTQHPNLRMRRNDPIFMVLTATYLKEISKNRLDEI